MSSKSHGDQFLLVKPLLSLTCLTSLATLPRWELATSTAEGVNPTPLPQAISVGVSVGFEATAWYILSLTRNFHCSMWQMVMKIFCNVFLTSKLPTLTYLCEHAYVLHFVYRLHFLCVCVCMYCNNSLREMCAYQQ